MDYSNLFALPIALGLLSGYAAFIASGEMAVAYLAVAYFMMNAPKGFLPTVNGGDLAVLYCFVFLCIAAQGSGIWSIDAMLTRLANPEILNGFYNAMVMQL